MAQMRQKFGNVLLLLAALCAPMGVAAYLVSGKPGLLPGMLLVAQVDIQKGIGRPS